MKAKLESLSFTKEQIEFYIEKLNEKLRERQVKGEIALYGGAVICLVFNARISTKDVDAVFKPTKIFREVAKEIAGEYELRPNWLNDAVKGWLSEYGKVSLFREYSNLRVFVAEPEYLLAMKSLASRADSSDKDDIKLLIIKLELKSPEEVFDIIGKYYPQRIIKPVTQYLIQELFQDL